MKYRKRSIVIEAKQWKGNNLEEISKFMEYTPHIGRADSLWIQTLEGNMLAMPNDWIIKGVKGEFYPCRPDVFRITYERVD